MKATKTKHTIGSPPTDAQTGSSPFAWLSIAISACTFAWIVGYHAAWYPRYMAIRGTVYLAHIKSMPFDFLTFLWTVVAFVLVGWACVLAALVRQEPRTGLAVLAFLLNVVLPAAAFVVSDILFPIGLD